MGCRDQSRYGLIIPCFFGLYLLYWLVPQSLYNRKMKQQLLPGGIELLFHFLSNLKQDFLCTLPLREAFRLNNSPFPVMRFAYS